METARQTKKEREKELCFKKLLYACVYLYDVIKEEEEMKIREEESTQKTSTGKGQVTTYLTP